METEYISGCDQGLRFCYLAKEGPINIEGQSLTYSDESNESDVGANETAHSIKNRRSGAQRRRYRKWLSLGKTPEEASFLSKQPLYKFSTEEDPSPKHNETVKTDSCDDQTVTETVDFGSESMSVFAKKPCKSGVERRRQHILLSKGKTLDEVRCLYMQPLAKVKSDEHPHHIDYAMQSHNINSNKLAESDYSDSLGVYRTGAQRRRLHYWLSQGKNFEESSVLCKQRYESFRCEQKSDRRANKRQHSNYQSSSSNDSYKMDKGTLNGRSDVKCMKLQVNNECKTTKVGIRDAERALGNTELNQIQESIIKIIDSMKGGVGPKFRSLYIKVGCVVIACENKTSCDWLTSHLDEIKPWNGANLMLVDFKDLCKRKIGTARIKSKACDNKTLLNRLSLQNKELNCKGWIVLNKKTDGYGEFVTFAIDKDSYRILKTRNCRVFNGLSSFLLQFKEGTQQEDTDGLVQGNCKIEDHSNNTSSFAVETRKPVWETQFEPEAAARFSTDMSLSHFNTTGQVQSSTPSTYTSGACQLSFDNRAHRQDFGHGTTTSHQGMQYQGRHKPSQRPSSIMQFLSNHSNHPPYF